MMQPGSSSGDSTRANDADRADVCAILDNAYTCLLYTSDAADKRGARPINVSTAAGTDEPPRIQVTVFGMSSILAPPPSYAT